MFTFKQFCELSVNNNGSFLFYLSLLPSLTEEERATIYIESIETSAAWNHNNDLCVVWYPKEAWDKRQAYLKIFYENAKRNRLLEESRKAIQTLEALDNEIFPEDLPTMKQLIEKRISAELSFNYAEVREVDKLMSLRARKDSRDT